jgi:hypothetical protein
MGLPSEVKVALVTAACVLSIAIVFKNVLFVQADFIVSNSPSYLFILYVLTGASKKQKCGNPLYWSLAIIFVTLLTITLYAI